MTTNKTKKKQNAFTMIELLVVIAIIGILAAAVLVSLAGMGKRARASRAIGQLSSAIPAMYSCWGNGGNTLTTVPGNICSLGSSYGSWPDMGSIGYTITISGIPSTKTEPWFFSANNSTDNIRVCCNSKMKSCGIPSVDPNTCSVDKVW